MGDGPLGFYYCMYSTVLYRPCNVHGCDKHQSWKLVLRERQTVVVMSHDTVF
jgi:hypothetical protein